MTMVHHLKLGGGKSPLSLIQANQSMPPGVGISVIDDHCRGGRRQDLLLGALIKHGSNAAGGRIKFHAQIFIFQNQIFQRSHKGIFHRFSGQEVGGIAKCRNFSPESDAVTTIQFTGRVDLLAGHTASHVIQHHDGTPHGNVGKGAGLHFHGSLHRPGMRIKHYHRKFGIVQRNIDLIGQGAQRLGLHPVGNRNHLAQLITGIVVSPLQTGTRQSIVELVEQKLLPLGRQIFEAAAQAHLLCQQAPLFSGQQAILGPAVHSFNGGFGCVAASSMMLQIAFHHRQLTACNLIEKRIRIAEGDVYVRFAALQLFNGFNVGNGGAAAVVTHAVEEHDIIYAVGELVHEFIHPFGDIFVDTVARGQTEGVDAAAVGGLPGKEATGQFGVFLGAWALEHVVVHAGEL